MSIPNNTPLKRRPTHPGEVLREDFMPDYDLTVSGLATALGVSRQTVNELMRERRALSPDAYATEYECTFGKAGATLFSIEQLAGLVAAA